jgi:hypothetical protein
MDTERNCPSCRKPLPANAPKGLCPECLMKAGFGTGIAPEPGRPSRTPAFIPPPVAEVAKLFPQFEILELLGQGGMGAVYKARQLALDRLVALKILPPQTGADAGFTDRFTREARALARLNHPNIVAVYEFGQVTGAPAAPPGSDPQPSTLNPQPSGNLHFFVMEYVEGLNLRQLEQAGKLAPREALKIIPQICDALQFAHDEGIVHRDVKPENVMLDKKGRVKITDFGLAKILGIEPEALRLTGAKDVMGTPHYMAPEQIEHPQEVDHRADIYSLGVVFYEMLTGELPLGKFQPPSRKVEVDVRLDEVVLHALEKEPDRRYQQASAVKSDVETIARGERAAAPNVGHPAAAGRGRILRMKSACFLFAAACFVVAAVVFVSSGNTLAAVLSLVAVVGFGIAGYLHWCAAVEATPTATPPDPAGSAGNPASPDWAAVERAKRLVRWPAICLITFSLLSPFMLGVVVFSGRLKAGEWMFIPLIIELVLVVVTALGGFKLLLLESRRMAIAGGIAGCVLSFFNFLCLPFAVWALAAASRREVRRGFELAPLAQPPDQAQPALPRSPRKLALTVAGVLLLVVAVVGVIGALLTLLISPEIARRVTAANQKPTLLGAAPPGAASGGSVLPYREPEQPAPAVGKRKRLTAPGTSTASPAAPLPFAQAKAGEFKVALTNGIEFEVAALASSPRSSTVWWRPDGTLLPEAPGDKIGDLAGLCPGGKSRTEFGVLARLAGNVMTERELVLAFSPQPQYAAAASLYKGNAVTDSVILAGFRTAPESLVCRIGVPEGAWERVATWDQAGTLLNNETGDSLELALASANGETCLRLAHTTDVNLFGLRLTARLKSGAYKTARICREEYSDSQAVRTCALIQGLQDVDVVAYELYRVPLRWALVPSIATKPSVPPLEARQAAASSATDQAGPAGDASPLSALSEADRARAVALFNDIEDFGHEFSAAFTARNLAAAQTGTRRLLTLLTNFNAVVKGTDCEFPAAIFADIAKVRQALDGGDWERVKQAAAFNEEYNRQFKRIASRMVEVARQPGAGAGTSGRVGRTP